MSNSNPFDFSEYGMNKGGPGQASDNDPFAAPPASSSDSSHPGAPPPAPRPSGAATSDPFAQAPGPADPFGGASDQFATPGDPFGGAPPDVALAGSSANLTAAKPPFLLLVIALVLAIAAGVVALLLSHVVVAFVCWFVAGPIAIGLLALFVRKDTYARSGGLYASPGFVRPLYWIAVVGCLLAIWAPAWRIADWVGHL